MTDLAAASYTPDLPDTVLALASGGKDGPGTFLTALEHFA